ncbi:hypothetical protein V8C86DRAFT_2483326 [Haematococcus lacustris]
MAPPASYLQHVLAPLMRNLGLAPDLKVTLLSRGFYPKGGGVVAVQGSALAPGHRLPPFTLADQGQVRPTSLACGGERASSQPL